MSGVEVSDSRGTVPPDGATSPDTDAMPSAPTASGAAGAVPPAASSARLAPLRSLAAPSAPSNRAAATSLTRTPQASHVRRSAAASLARCEAGPSPDEPAAAIVTSATFACARTPSSVGIA